MYLYYSVRVWLTGLSCGILYIYICIIYNIPQNVHQSSGCYFTSHFNVRDLIQQNALQCKFYYNTKLKINLHARKHHKDDIT
jgi:hypothetical protein